MVSSAAEAHGRHPRAVAGLFAAYGVAGLFWGAFAAATPAIQSRAGLEAGAFGLALGVMSLAAFPVMRVWGRIVGRLGACAIPVCFAAFAAGCFFLALASSLWALVLALALLGAASGALDISLNLRTAEVEAATGAALFNRGHALFPAAMLVSAALTGAARETGIGVPAIFAAVALAFVAAALADLRTAPRAPGAGRRDQGRRVPLGRALVVLAAIAALAAFLEAAAQAWAAIFVETVQGARPAVAALAPAAFVLGLSLGRLAAHAVETRWRARTVLLVAALCAAPAFAVIASAPPVALTVAACLVAGCGVGPVEPAVFRSAARTAEPDRGPALATVTAIAYLGYLLSPPVLGGVVDIAGWASMWGVTALLALVIAALTRAR